MRGLGLRFKIRKILNQPQNTSKIYNRLLEFEKNPFEETISVKSVKSTRDYDLKHIDAFGYMNLKGPSLTPYSGLVCSDRNEFYIQIVPVTNSNGSERFNHTIGNQFFDLSIFVSKNLIY